MKANIDPRIVTSGSGVLVVEASTARLPVGSFPDAIGIDGTTYWRTQRVERDPDGDVIAVVYDCGVPRAPQLHVLND